MIVNDQKFASLFLKSEAMAFGWGMSYPQLLSVKNSGVDLCRSNELIAVFSKEYSI